MGGTCVEIDTFPNATVAEYGEVIGAEKMKAEIFQRGPIACGRHKSYAASAQLLLFWLYKICFLFSFSVFVLARRNT